MATFLDDQSVAERVLRHVAEGTTDTSAEVWREPVANYRSQPRFEAELQVLQRSPTPFCPSAALSEPGAFVAREAAGTPLLAVRDEQGEVHVFRNACRHRGMALAEGSGCGKAFVCRYHGWTYQLDGQLRHIPDEYGFAPLDKGQHGLVRVPSQEKSGLVLVTQDEPLGDAEALAGIDDVLGPEQRMMATGDFELEVNWKIFLESFLEGYHIRSTHRDTFYPYGFDNLNVIESCGRNSRITFPFRRIEKLAEVPPAERRLQGLVTFVYHLFPNVLVTMLSHHTALVVLEPVTISRTRLVSYTLADCGDNPLAVEAFQRDAAFVNDTGAQEDREVVRAIQRSLASGANEVFTFGRFEGAIAHFHRNLAAALAELP